VYKITLINDDKEILLHHFSNDPEAPKILSAKGKFGFNGVPSVTIEVPVTNKAFNEFYELVSHIKIEDHNGIEIFYGRMINPSDIFNNVLSKILIFEGELAYLNDTTIRPREWHDYSVKDFLKEILDEHNNQVEDYKKIYLGNVTVTANLYRTADYENTLTLLLDRLPNRLGGFFVLRKIDGKKYLDYLLNVGKVSNQEIVFGENMLDYQTECDTTGIYTKLIPLGASKTDGSEESKVGNRLTINEVNDDKDYLINEDAAKVYGLIETTETWNDVTIASNLKRKGEEYLKEISKPRRSLKMKIADMHEIDIKYDKFSLGDEVPIKCKIFNVDERFRIIEIAIDFLNPLNTTYTFGNKFGTLTDTQLIIKNTQAKLDSFFNENGLLSSYLEGTINLLNNNMRAMVDSADKHNGTAILFECKVPGDLYGAMAIGTKGFMIADELNADGTWNWRTFGTAKGFVADMIIAGSMIADRIKSGLLMSMNEKTWINMDDGTFNFADVLKLIDGKLILSHTNGNEGISIDKGGIKVTTNSANNGMEEVAKIIATSFAKDRNQNGVSICTSGYGDYIQIGYQKEDGTIRAAAYFVPVGVPESAGLPFSDAGMYIYDPLFIKNSLNIKSSGIDHQFMNLSGNYLGIYGDNGLEFGYKSGTALKTRLKIHESPPSGTGDLFESYGNWNFKGYTLHNINIQNSNLTNNYANLDSRSAASVTALESCEEDTIRYIYKDIRSIGNKIILNIPNKYKGCNYRIIGVAKKGFGDYSITSEEEARFTIETDRELIMNIEISIDISLLRKEFKTEEAPLSEEVNYEYENS